MPKVLTCRKGKFPLANWTSVAKGQGHKSQNDGQDISSTSFPRRDPNEERSSAVMAPINRSQTYPAVLPPCKSRKELANWTWVRLGNPRPKLIIWKNKDISKDKTKIPTIRH